MMPRKSGCVDIISFRSLVGFRKHLWNDLFVIPGWSEGPDPESRDSGFVSLRYTPRNDEEHLSDIGEARRALVDVGVHRLELIGAAHQFHLLDGLGEQRRARVDGKIV